jgi:hypothetical protein
LLHALVQRVEFGGQRVDIGLLCAGEPLVRLDRQDHRVGPVVLGDDDRAVFRHAIEHPPEAVLRLAGGHVRGVACGAAGLGDANGG